MMLPKLLRIPPGSAAAIGAGCTCPTDTNRNGLGLKLALASSPAPDGMSVQAAADRDSLKYFHVADSCPVHGNGAAPQPINEETTTQTTDRGSDMAARDTEYLATKLLGRMRFNGQGMTKSEAVEEFDLSNYEWNKTIRYLLEAGEVTKVGERQFAVYYIAGMEPKSEKTTAAAADLGENGSSHQDQPEPKAEQPVEALAETNGHMVELTLSIDEATRNKLAVLAIEELLTRVGRL